MVTSICLFFALSCIILQVESSGNAEFEFREYYDDDPAIGCRNVCDIRFRNIRISDVSGSELFNHRQTAVVYNARWVNFTSRFSAFRGDNAIKGFTLKTNTTVILSMDVMDKKRSDTNPIRTISIPDIGYGSLAAGDNWKKGQWNLPPTLPNVLLFKYRYRLKSCSLNFRGLGCNFCTDNYFTLDCNVYCSPVTGNYTCDPLTGDKVCVAGKTGKDCDKCEKDHVFGQDCDQCVTGWDGGNCDRCGPNYYPVNSCDVFCEAQKDIYNCTAEGEKLCLGNHAAPECTSCRVGWKGTLCNTCASNYYPVDNCTVFCETVDGVYNCTSNGDKICLGNYAGLDCSACKTGWKGTECDFCADNYYPAGRCTKLCEPVSYTYDCTSEGDKLCLGNRAGVDCLSCIIGWTGTDCNSCASNYYPDNNCTVFCQSVKDTYECTADGEKLCLGNHVGGNCSDCKEHFYSSTCSVYCNETEQYGCDNQGEKLCKLNYYSVDCSGKREKVEGASAAVIGGGAGGGAVLLIIVLLFVLLLRKRRRRKDKESPVKLSAVIENLSHSSPKRSHKPKPPNRPGEPKYADISILNSDRPNKMSPTQEEDHCYSTLQLEKGEPSNSVPSLEDDLYSKLHKQSQSRQNRVASEEEEDVTYADVTFVKGGHGRGEPEEEPRYADVTIIRGGAGASQDQENDTYVDVTFVGNRGLRGEGLRGGVGGEDTIYANNETFETTPPEPNYICVSDVLKI